MLAALRNVWFHFVATRRRWLLHIVGNGGYSVYSSGYSIGKSGYSVSSSRYQATVDIL
jgi:hypothetical protein